MGDQFLRYLDELERAKDIDNPEAMPDANYGGVPFVQEQANQFKRGGRSRKASKKSLRSLADVIASKGRHGDTMLAHINPEEAMLLKAAGGSGTINPETGQPEFFLRGVRNFFKNPGKTIGKTFKNPKRTIADAISTAAAIFGGPVGGAIGGGIRSMLREDDDLLGGILRGAGYGYGAPHAAALAARGLGAVGAQTASNALANYATTNASSLMGNVGANLGATNVQAPMFVDKILGKEGAVSPSLAQKIGLGVSAGSEAPTDPRARTREELSSLSTNELADMANRTKYLDALAPVQKSFTDKTMDFLSQPQTLMNLGSIGLNAYNSAQMAKEAKKAKQAEREYNSPKAVAARNREYQKAMKLTPEEIAENNSYLHLLQGKYDANFNPYAINTHGKYRIEHTPEEAQRTGQWFSYTDKPPVYAEGGPVRGILEVIQSPTMQITESRFVGGDTGGQDDKIPAMLSDGEYVIDASTVADLGDGNSKKGADKLDAAVKNIRKHKRGGTLKLPPKAKPIVEYIKRK